MDLRVCEGEVVGCLGESGSGKSTLAKSLLRLLPRTARVEGDIEFEGRKLWRLTDREMNEPRGARIPLVPQEPVLALNPLMKIGDQIAEVLRAGHSGNCPGRSSSRICARESMQPLLLQPRTNSQVLIVPVSNGLSRALYVASHARESPDIVQLCEATAASRSVNLALRLCFE